MKRNLYLTSSAAIALAMAVQGVSVQPAQAQDADSDFAIEEIIVTARKREENIQDAPLSIAAFTSDMIQSANIKTLDDIAKFTAGFSFDEDFQRSNSDRPIIRGQSTILGASGVSTFIDGVLINGTILDYDLNDVERVEIIKGPQSALYGRNTYSGAISIITKSPTDEFSGNVKIEAGEFNQYDMSMAVRGPLSDTVSFSLSGRHYRRGGPFTNTFDRGKVGQQQSSSLAGVLYFEPNEKLDIRVRVRVSSLDDDQPRLFTTDPSENNCFFDIGGVYLGLGRYFCGEITEHPIEIDDERLLDRKGFDKNTTWQSSVTVGYEFSDNVSLTWITGYNYSESESAGDFGYTPESLNPFAVYIGPVFPVGFPFDPFWFHAFVIGGPVADFALDQTGHSRDFSSEFRLEYESDKWEGLIGGYYYQDNNFFQQNRGVPSALEAMMTEGFDAQEARMTNQCFVHANDAFAPCWTAFFPAILNFGETLAALEFEANQSLSARERENLAVFGRISRKVTDKLEVSAEARLVREEISTVSTIRNDIYDFLGTFQRRDTFDTISRSTSFTDINPRFTASYAMTDGSNLYAVAARGNKPGGFNNTNVIELGLGTFDEETVWSYELGSKNVLMDGRLIINLAAFYNTISKYQLTQSVVIPSLNQTTTVIDNLGKVRLKGLEVEAVFAPAAIPGLIFNANYAYTDSDILEGTDINQGKLNDIIGDGRVNCTFGTADPAVPTCDTLGDNTLPGSIVGRRLPRQAKHMWNVGLNYTSAITDNWAFVFNSNLSHESRKFVQVHNLAWVGAATLLNGSIGFQSETVRVVFWGKNLTNEDAVVGVSRFADEATSFVRVFMGNPRIGRQFGATATYNF